MSPGLILYCVLVVFLAAVVRGFSGFGFALLAITSLTLVLDPARVVPAIFLLELAAGLHLLPQIRGQVHWASLTPLLLGALVATPIGVHALAHYPAAPLKIALGVCVIVAGGLLLAGYRLKRVPGAGATFATGAAAGVLNGAFGIGGPPIILFFVGSPLGSAIGRASIIVAFLAIDIVGLAYLALYGLIGWDSLTLTAVILLPLITGVALGARLIGRFDETRVRTIVIMILMALALISIAQGLRS